MSYHFHVGRDDEARDLIEAFHYSGRWPGNVQVVGSWHEDGGLYWRALTKEGRRKAARLGLRSEAYPKPQKVAA